MRGCPKYVCAFVRHEGLCFGEGWTAVHSCIVEGLVDSEATQHCRLESQPAIVRPDLHNRQLEVGAPWIVADDGAHFVIRPSCGIERGSMPAHTGPLGGLVHIEECANVRARAARQVRGALPRQVHLIVLCIAGRLVGDHLMHCPHA